MTLVGGVDFSFSTLALISILETRYLLISNVLHLVDAHQSNHHLLRLHRRPPRPMECPLHQIPPPPGLSSWTSSMSLWLATRKSSKPVSRNFPYGSCADAHVYRESGKPKTKSKFVSCLFLRWFERFRDTSANVGQPKLKWSCQWQGSQLGIWLLLAHCWCLSPVECTYS